MTAILVWVFGQATGWCTSGGRVEILGGSIVTRGVGARQKAGMGGFDGIWVWIWFESWIVLDRRTKREGGSRRESSRCTHVAKLEVLITDMTTIRLSILRTGPLQRDSKDAALYRRRRASRLQPLTLTPTFPRQALSLVDRTATCGYVTSVTVLTSSPETSSRSLCYCICLLDGCIPKHNTIARLN